MTKNVDLSECNQNRLMASVTVTGFCNALLEASSNADLLSFVPQLAVKVSPSDSLLPGCAGLPLVEQLEHALLCLLAAWLFPRHPLLPYRLRLAQLLFELSPSMLGFGAGQLVTLVGRNTPALCAPG